MSEEPRDINYVCDKVDKIENTVYELEERPIGKTRYGLYLLVFLCFSYSCHISHNLVGVQTQLQNVETKINNLEQMLKNK